MLKLFCLIVCILLSEAIVPFNRGQFHVIQHYLEDIYDRPHTNTANIKWFDTDLRSHGYVEYDTTRNAIVVAFRGSYTLTNWAHNLKVALVPSGDCSGCKVHKGFLLTYRSARNFVLQTVENFRKAHPSAGVYVTGHSLGGAQAVFLTVDLYKRGIQANLMTFGAPRPGNQAYANYANNLIKGVNYRITFRYDKIPILPFRVMGYRHVGTEVNFSKINKYDVESKFSDKAVLFFSLLKYNFLDHKKERYFQLS